MEKPLKYSKVKVIKITEIQFNTLEKMRNRKVNVAQFIRIAIAEKIKRDYADLQVKEEKIKTPF
jgi:post-segregation antitoxin (ccd killing protein)